MTFGMSTSNLFEVLTQGDTQAAVPVVEHFAGHQGIEDGGAGQRYAEVETKQPPVLGILIELKERHPFWDYTLAAIYPDGWILPK